MLYDLSRSFQLALHVAKEALRWVDTASAAVAERSGGVVDEVTARRALFGVLAFGAVGLVTAIALGKTTLAEVSGFNRVVRYLDAVSSAVTAPVCASVFVYAALVPEQIPLLQLGATLVLTLTLFRALRHLEAKLDDEAHLVLSSLSRLKRGGSAQHGAHVQHPPHRAARRSDDGSSGAGEEGGDAAAKGEVGVAETPATLRQRVGGGK